MLLNLFEFGDEDLAMNRRGLMTARQTEWVRNMAGGLRRSQAGVAKTGIFFLFFGLCVVFGMYWINESTREALLSNPSDFLPVLIVIPVVTAVFVSSIYFANRRAERLLASGVRKAEGLIQLDEEHSSETGSAYHAYIGKTKFSFAENVRTMFEEGRRYRFYYCETAMLRLVLSYKKIE